jgi:malonyl CoA-acyl carrier protein transacylase
VEAEIAALKPDAVIEAGPGNVLQGLWAAAENGIPCQAYKTYERE